MKTKKYQKLRSNNLKAAECIYEALKSEKAISLNDFQNLFFNSRVDLPSNGQFNNWQTTEQFLFDHGLMTSHLINGLKIYVATQKCVRTHSFENATIEYQYTTYDKIGEVMKYQKINDGMVEPEVEGMIIGKMLGFTGDVLKKYAKVYAYEFLLHVEDGELDEYIRYAITSPTHQIPEIKVLN